ncbi:hypothetical protein Taro_044248 [Colocasia esculenta]|uniref:Uncharacterized protein n=1 Tax=Colocasia esculenta TaxID=4460 RepID=A0A843WXU1_COLES|nr:hypothetical protein [Colocasia esculenta]
MWLECGGLYFSSYTRQMFTASVLVYGLLELGEFPTEPVTREAHRYSPQAKVKRKFRYRLPVQGRVVAVLGQRLQQCRGSTQSGEALPDSRLGSIPRRPATPSEPSRPSNQSKAEERSFHVSLHGNRSEAGTSFSSSSFVQLAEPPRCTPFGGNQHKNTLYHGRLCS